ncbi:hypothetical protein DM860_001714 [Cuscuta australis]|uniref:DUF506 domain-containing protein n=1 Tax=Cuscuta australis TaxID=267555 RepID=A0A328EB27_9ASTE|nr:hypothetical protein DM860_001714 [Cuscuta australis]
MTVTKIVPIGSQAYGAACARNDSGRPISKSRFKRLFDFPSVLRNSSAAEKLAPAAVAGGEVPYGKGGFSTIVAEFEPSSICLTKMVQNFIEESNEKQTPKGLKCGRSRCNCFNGKSDDSSDEEFDFTDFRSADYVRNPSFCADSSDSLKSLVVCASPAERNLLAETSKIAEKNKAFFKSKEDSRKIVADGLGSLGYTASICRSKWEKTSKIPAGVYEYIDVTVEGDRVLIDVDFRSEFEIARSTGGYKAVLQSLPFIFVGKPDRLLQIVSIASEAAKLSLKKKGMHIPPWRKAEYMKAKWLSPYTRTPPPRAEPVAATDGIQAEAGSEYGDLDLIFGEKEMFLAKNENATSALSPPSKKPEVIKWQPPEIKPKGGEKRNEFVATGLAALFKEKS